jgi:hypothetical protein
MRRPVHECVDAGEPGVRRVAEPAGVVRGEAERMRGEAHHLEGVRGGHGLVVGEDPGRRDGQGGVHRGGVGVIAGQGRRRAQRRGPVLPLVLVRRGSTRRAFGRRRRRDPWSCWPQLSSRYCRDPPRLVWPVRVAWRPPARAPVSRPLEHAHELLDRANHIELSAADFKRFVTEIDKPSEAVPELTRLLKRKSQIPSG